MKPELTILVPIYNEERTLAAVMRTISEKCPDAQVIYINDGSKDRSIEILHANARPQDIVLTKPNGGKGSAIRYGLERAEGEYTVIQDADLEYDPAELLLLLDLAKAHPGTAAFGSRFLKKNPNIYKLFLMGNKVLTACLNIIFNCRITDSYTCFKLLPTPLFQSLNLTSNGFELEAEICAKCVKSGIRILEIPISYNPRSIEEGKKIRFADAWKGLRMMLKVRFMAQR